MRALLAAAGAVIIGGCAAAPFEYRAQTDIPEGPGMLTGAAGAFSLRPAESLPPRARQVASPVSRARSHLRVAKQGRRQ